VSKPLILNSISGALIRHGDTPKPTIVFVHGRSANPMEVFPLAEVMFREGFNVVLWEHRRAIGYGQQAIDEILGIVRHIRADPFVDKDRIFLVGFSLGGAMVIGAAAHDQNHEIAGIVADSSYANLKRATFRYLTAFGWIPSFMIWPTAFVTFQVARAVHGIDFQASNPSQWARHVECPVLLIHGSNDWRIPVDHALQIYSQLPCQKHLWLVDGVGHTGAFSTKRYEYARRVKEFFSESRCILPQ